jgi:hypothetical protein
MSRPFRAELKYVITHDQRCRLLELWGRHLVKDAHSDEDARTPILSQYYDTPELTFVREKVDGISFRNKVRLRTYGYRFSSDGAVVVEIKQRLGDRVRKVREFLPDFQDEQLDPAAWRFQDPANRAAFNVLMERHRLVPSAQTWYLREAYECVVEPEVRVTFDSSLTALHPGEQLSRSRLSDPRAKVLTENLIILEVKSTAGLPPWVTSGALAVGLEQRAVPKYVMCIAKLGLHAALPLPLNPTAARRRRVV